MKTNFDPRHQARRLALSYIYATEINDQEQNIHFFLESLEIKKFDKDLFKGIVKGYKLNIDRFAELSREALSTWNEDQLLSLDLVIINIAVLESYILESVPVKVAVDEAIELAKEFGSEKSSKFVNGVLAKIITDNKNEL